MRPGYTGLDADVRNRLQPSSGWGSIGAKMMTRGAAVLTQPPSVDLSTGSSSTSERLTVATCISSCRRPLSVADQGEHLGLGRDERSHRQLDFIDVTGAKHPIDRSQAVAVRHHPADRSDTDHR